MDVDSSPNDRTQSRRRQRPGQCDGAFCRRRHQNLFSHERRTTFNDAPPRKFQLRHSQTRLSRSPEAARNFSTEQQEWTLTDDGTMADTAGLYLRDDNAKVDIIGLDCMTDRTMRDWKMS